MQETQKQQLKDRGQVGRLPTGRLLLRDGLTGHTTGKQSLNTSKLTCSFGQTLPQEAVRPEQLCHSGRDEHQQLQLSSAAVSAAADSEQGTCRSVYLGIETRGKI